MGELCWCCCSTNLTRKMALAVLHCDLDADLCEGVVVADQDGDESVRVGQLVGLGELGHVCADGDFEQWDVFALFLARVVRVPVLHRVRNQAAVDLLAACLSAPPAQRRFHCCVRCQ